MSKSKCKCKAKDIVLDEYKAELSSMTMLYQDAQLQADTLRNEIEKQNGYIDTLHRDVATYREEIARLQAGSDICQSKPDIHIEIHNAEFKL